MPHLVECFRPHHGPCLLNYTVMELAGRRPKPTSNWTQFTQIINLRFFISNKILLESFELESSIKVKTFAVADPGFPRESPSSKSGGEKLLVWRILPKKLNKNEKKNGSSGAHL